MSIQYKTHLDAGSWMRVVYEGLVTQSGTMMDGHTFRAVQNIRMVMQIDNRDIQCEILRTESQKFVDNSALLSPTLPLYLNQYLSSFGSCRERVRGLWLEEDEGLVCLKAYELPEMLRGSDVKWSPHLYFLMVYEGGKRLDGIAINQDRPDDRENDVGFVFVQRVGSLLL